MKRDIGLYLQDIWESFLTIEEYTQVPWKKIAGMRDIIAHEYFGVKLERVWDVVVKDLPLLKQQMLLILEDEK